MRNPAINFAIALGEAPAKGIKPRRFLWVRAVTRDTPAVDASMGVWTGDRDIDVTLIDGQTFTSVTRTYFGMGRKLRIPAIPRMSDLTIQTIECKLSQLSLVTQTMVRENNVRFAKVDIHEGLLHTRTKLLVSNPELVFAGEVDGDPIDTPKTGGEGSITLEMVSDAIRALTRTNPAMRSYETQAQLSGDQFGKHTASVRNFQFDWGE